MLLNVSVLGVNSKLITTNPPKKQYQNTTFYGNAIYDNFQCLNIELSDTEIKNINTQQSFTENTIMLADYEGDLQAGNFTKFNMPITHWRIYRKKKTESLFKLLKQIPRVSGNNYYIDYTPQNNVEYDYKVFPFSVDTEGNGIEGVGIVSFDFGWILCDEDEDIVYKFDVELDTSDIQTLRDAKLFDNNSEFPAFRFGKRKYDVGTISTIPLDVENNQYVSKLETLEDLKSFINNNEIKILKNAKGQIWKVITTDFSVKYMDRIAEQPYTINFTFSQVGSV